MVHPLLSLAVGPEKKYKSREDFPTADDYARYVRDNLSVGIMVRCCEAYEEVRMGDVGRVMKVRTKFWFLIVSKALSLAKMNFGPRPSHLLVVYLNVWFLTEPTHLNVSYRAGS